MLRVTLDIIPFGSEAHRRTIGTLEIINDGTGDRDTGNYDVSIDGRTARVEDHDREDGAWVLLRRALEALEG